MLHYRRRSFSWLLDRSIGSLWQVPQSMKVLCTLSFFSPPFFSDMSKCSKVIVWDENNDTERIICKRTLWTKMLKNVKTDVAKENSITLLCLWPAGMCSVSQQLVCYYSQSHKGALSLALPAARDRGHGNESWYLSVRCTGGLSITYLYFLMLISVLQREI